jgi:cyanophycinase
MPIFLAGGSEFTRCMSEPDLRLMELAGGFDAPIRIIPAAAAPDNNHVRAGENGVRWFKQLGATDVQVVFVIDRLSANDEDMAASLRFARLVYLLGGFPEHLGTSLRESLCWNAIRYAWQDGAVIAGSSAGAMVLCEYYYDPYARSLLKGLDLLHNTCLIPHHNSSGANWAADLRSRLPDVTLIGVDECAGILCTGDAASSPWTVHGSGAASLYPPGSPASAASLFTKGQSFHI